MFDLSFQPENETERKLFGELMYYQRLFSACHMALQRIANDGNPLENIQKDARGTLDELDRLSAEHQARIARGRASA